MIIFVMGWLSRSEGLFLLEGLFFLENLLPICIGHLEIIDTIQELLFGKMSLGTFPSKMGFPFNPKTPRDGEMQAFWKGISLVIPKPLGMEKCKGCTGLGISFHETLVYNMLLWIFKREWIQDTGDWKLDGKMHGMSRVGDKLPCNISS